MKESRDQIIELVNEEGEIEKFTELTRLEIEDNKYVILMPVTEEQSLQSEEPSLEEDETVEEVEVVILKMDHDDEGQLILVNIEDKDELEDVIAAYEAISDEII